MASKADQDASQAARDRRVQQLERRIAGLEKRLKDVEAAQPWARPAAPLPPPAAPPAAGAPAWVPVESPGPAPAPWAPAAPPAAAPREHRSLESVLGANWLARAGMLLLALGVVFFLRLAYDRGWVPIPGRYAIGAGGGLALWILGDALRGRRLDPAFAQVLAGGGAVILYITLYCGYAIPDYREALGMSLPLTLGLLALASVLLGAYAVWRDLPLLGGVAAGLATILLAPAGDFSVAGVLYATFLDTGLLLAAAWRRWPPVEFTAIVAANVPIMAGFAEGFDWPVLLACAAVANGAALAASALSRGDRTLANVQAAVALLLLTAATAWSLQEAGVAQPGGWTSLMMGLLGLALSLALRRLAPGLGGTGAALLVLWPVLHFEDSYWTPLAHGVLALLAVGLAAAMPHARVGARAVAVAASVVGLVVYWGVTVQPDAGADVALALASGVTLAAAGVVAWLSLRPAGGTVAGAGHITLGAALLTALLTLAAVLDGWPVAVSWAALAVAVVVAGLAFGVAELRIAAFGLFGIVLARIFFVDLTALGVVGRVVAFLLTGALLLVAAFLYARARPRAKAATPPGPPPRPPSPPAPPPMPPPLPPPWRR